MSAEQEVKKESATGEENWPFLSYLDCWTSASFLTFSLHPHFFLLCTTPFVFPHCSVFSIVCLRSQRPPLFRWTTVCLFGPKFRWLFFCTKLVWSKQPGVKALVIHCAGEWAKKKKKTAELLLWNQSEGKNVQLHSTEMFSPPKLGLSFCLVKF